MIKITMTVVDDMTAKVSQESYTTESAVNAYPQILKDYLVHMEKLLVYAHKNGPFYELHDKWLQPVRDEVANNAK